MPLVWLAKAAFKNIIHVVYYMNGWMTLYCALKYFLKKLDSKLKLTYSSWLYRNKKPLNTGNNSLLKHGSCLRCLRNCGSKARLAGLTCHTASTDWVIVINVEKMWKGTILLSQHYMQKLRKTTENLSRCSGWDLKWTPAEHRSEMISFGPIMNYYTETCLLTGTSMKRVQIQ
jgi:hypothetical protein